MVNEIDQLRNWFTLSCIVLSGPVVGMNALYDPRNIAFDCRQVIYGLSILYYFHHMGHEIGVEEVLVIQTGSISNI